jgi:hypothetical protein
MKKYIFIITIIFSLNSCDAPRDLIIPTHLTRVPKPYNLKASVDSTKSGKPLVTIKWECDSNGNVRNYEISRAYLKGPYDTSQFYPIPPAVTVKTFADSTITAFTSDSMSYYYRVTVSGLDKFTGPASDFVPVILYKKKK